MSCQDYIIVISQDQLNAAVQLIPLSLPPTPLPSYNPYDGIGELAKWYIVPDSNNTLQSTYLLLLDTSQVPMALNHVTLVAADNIWRPDIIGTLWSCLAFICANADPEDLTAPLSVTRWLSQFVLHVVCGVGYIPKDEYEGQK